MQRASVGYTWDAKITRSGKKNIDKSSNDAKQGFHEIPKEKLPHKVWKECINCPKFPNCDEIAMMKEL